MARQLATAASFGTIAPAIAADIENSDRAAVLKRRISGSAADCGKLKRNLNPRHPSFGRHTATSAPRFGAVNSRIRQKR